MWSEYKIERKGIEKRRENERKTRKLEELIGMKIKEILFDSNFHKWNKNNSEFGSRIKGHRHECIVIEDKTIISLEDIYQKK